MVALPKLSFATLNPREQRLVTLLGIVLGVFLVLILPAFLQFLVITRRSDNEATRDAIQQVQTARASIRERQSRRDSIIQRYATKAPPLAGFIEQTARAQKLEVTDSQDRNLPGKKYEERTTTIHLKKAGMYGISKFLESLESKGQAVRVSRLNIRKRAAEQDSYDVEVGVTAWDRIESTPPAAAGSGQPPEKKP